MWRAVTRRLYLNNAFAPAVWLVGVHLLEGPRAGQFATADLHREPPAFFAGREPFSTAPPNITPRHPLSYEAAPPAVETQALCPRCGCNRYVERTSSTSYCAERGLGRASQPLRAERPSSPPSAAQARARAGEHLAQLRAQQRDRFAGASFAPFGLDARWRGRRWLGGFSTSNGGTHQLTLAHGDDPSDPSQSIVRVVTILPRPVLDDPRQNVAMEWSVLTRMQVGAVWRATGVLDPVVRMAAFPDGPDADDPTSPWDSVTLEVDEETVPFALLQQDEFWVAQAHWRELLIGITAVHWSPSRTALQTVTGEALQVYERGSEELHRLRSTSDDS